MDQQTKTKLMDLVSEALDKEAYVSIHFSQYETKDFKPVLKEDVEDKAKEIADLMSVNLKNMNTKESIVPSFNINAENINLCFSYLPTKTAAGYMEEDVFLEEDAV